MVTKMILLDQMAYFCPCTGPISHQINAWLLATVHHKINFYLKNQYLMGFFGKYRSKCALLCWKHTLSLLFRKCVGITIFKYQKKKKNLLTTDLLLQIFRPQESKKKKRKNKIKKQSHKIMLEFALEKVKSFWIGPLNF